TGHVHFESYIALAGGKQESLPVHLYFKGHVPENTTGMAKLAGGYDAYYDVDGNNLGSWYQSPSSVRDPLALYTLVCSNLQWSTSIEGVEPRNSLWDKYNYLTVKVRIDNTSEDSESHFYSQDYRIKVPNQGDANAVGLHYDQAMKWIYREGQDPIENPVGSEIRPSDREETFVGVPGQGGVLIFDVTDISQDTLDEWNLITFEDAVDDGGNPVETIPYHFTSDSSIMFKYDGKIYGTDREGIVDPEAEEKSYKEFYVAIPISTDIQGHREDQIPIHTWYTVWFGNNYSWTKENDLAGFGFEEVESNFTHGKYVLDDSGKKAPLKYASLGEEVDYYLGNFSHANSNVPAFNAAAIDSHNKDFDLQRISILSSYAIPFAYGAHEPQLSDWFKDTGTVEFGFYTIDTAASKPNNTVYVLDPATKKPLITYVPLGSMVPDPNLTTPTVKAWSLEIGDSIENYVKSHTNLAYANTFKVNFKERIEPDEEFDGVIQVHGVVNKPIKFDNSLVTRYETWYWLNKSVIN
ncbi:MAG: hypothetical protein K2F65_00655, partial [Eubacterium sp.]|nr:hypothetical protein [Eubacterium sp.]